MDYFGINSPEDLPKLKEVFDDSLVNPTTVQDAAATMNEGAADAKEEAEEDAGVLAVSSNGELIIEDISIDTAEEEDTLEIEQSSAQDQPESDESAGNNETGEEGEARDDEEEKPGA